jgi:hypothetical protein
MTFTRSQVTRPTGPTGAARPEGLAVRVFTPDYVLGGYVAPTGQAFLGWLNNVNQRAIVLTRAQVMGLAPDSVVPPRQRRAGLLTQRGHAVQEPHRRP